MERMQVQKEIWPGDLQAEIKMEMRANLNVNTRPAPTRDLISGCAAPLAD